MSSFQHRPTIRFFEADQQQVVYHMWYLAYFEDARNEMLADGRDVVAFHQGGRAGPSGRPLRPGLVSAGAGGEMISSSMSIRSRSEPAASD